MNRKFYRIWFIIGFLVSAGEVFPLFAIYTYDRSGSRTGVVFPDESVTALGKPSVRYCYDQANRLTKVIRTGAADQATTYEYYPDGLLQKINYANGVTSSLTYQDNGWVKSIDTVRHKAGQSDELISRYEYKYDGDGNRIEMQETNATPARRRVDSNWASAEVTTYAYDPQGRLIQVNYPDGRQANYSYDAVGNRTAETETKAGAKIKDRTFAYNPLNQLLYILDNLTLARSVGYTYDGRGETTAKIFGGIDSDGNVVSETQRLEFAWDPAGHLRKVTKKVPGGNDEVIAEFTYDYAGRRVRKDSRFSFLSGGPGPLESRLYAYDQTSALAEYGLDPTGHPLKDRQYIYGAELLAAERTTGNGQVTTSYYHQDALGSTVNLTQSTGELEESYLYDAWGNFRKVDVNGQYSPSPDVDPNGYFDWLTYLANSQGAFSEDWNRCTYTGHYYDPETGLYFFKARFYDPDLGRFDSEDPYLGKSEEPPSLHRYLYAYDSPLRYVDLHGYEVLQYSETYKKQDTVGIDEKIKEETRLKVAGAYGKGVVKGAGKGLLGLAIHSTLVMYGGVPYGVWYTYEEGKAVVIAVKTYGTAHGRESLVRSLKKAGPEWLADLIGETTGGVGSTAVVMGQFAPGGKLLPGVKLPFSDLNIPGATPEALPVLGGLPEGEPEPPGSLNLMPDLKVKMDKGVEIPKPLGFSGEEAPPGAPTPPKTLRVEGIDLSKLSKNPNSAADIAAKPGPQTWNEFQQATEGQFSSRAEAAKAWESYKTENGILTGSVRNPVQRSAFLKQMAESEKTPSWMKPWLKEGKTPPGYEVDHIKPLSAGGVD